MPSNYEFPTVPGYYVDPQDNTVWLLNNYEGMSEWWVADTDEFVNVPDWKQMSEHVMIRLNCKPEPIINFTK